jgi:hypothetical protein
LIWPGVNLRRGVRLVDRDDDVIRSAQKRITGRKT